VCRARAEREFAEFLGIPSGSAVALHRSVVRSARGFTLIEVIVAAGLLVVIALGTAQLFGVSLQRNIAARDQLMMTTLAARALDQLIATAAGGALTTSPPDSLDRDYDGFGDMAGQGGAIYARRWWIALPPEHGGATAAIVVRVFRPETPGQRVEIASLAQVSP
jgi:prepilin-type N-terminal cleavage/methylation domain-containing protein